MDLISLMEFMVIITMFVISMFWKAPNSITNALTTVFVAPSCHVKHVAPSQPPHGVGSELLRELPVRRAGLRPAWIQRFQSYLAGRVI